LAGSLLRIQLLSVYALQELLSVMMPVRLDHIRHICTTQPLHSHACLQDCCYSTTRQQKKEEEHPIDSPLLSCMHSPFTAHTLALVLIQMLIQCYNCRATLQLDRQRMLWTVCNGSPTTLCRTTMQTWPSQARLATLGMTTHPGEGLRT